MLKSGSSEHLEVLVVDDDKVVALLHKHCLRTSTVKKPPVVCTNGEEALKYIQKKDQKEKCFLVLLDLNMPVLDGWKFLENIDTKPPLAKVFVVVVTSSINRQDYLKAQTYEQVIDFCHKPLTPECILKIKNLEPLNSFFSAE